MFAMAMDNAVIVEDKEKHVVTNAVATEDADIAVEREKYAAENVMEKVRFILMAILKNAENVVEQVKHHAQNVPLQA